MTTEKKSTTTTSSTEYEAPLGDSTSAKLSVISGVPRITITGDSAMRQLLQAKFEQPLPKVSAADGEVRIRYPSYALLNWLVYWRQPRAVITMNPSVPWTIEIHGGVSSFQADLSQLKLSGLEIGGGASHLWANLPAPTGTVIIRVGGGISDMAIHRPAAIPVRVQVRGGTSSLRLDDQHLGPMGGETQLETPGYKEAVNRYEIQISGGVSKLTIDT